MNSNVFQKTFQAKIGNLLSRPGNFLQEKQMAQVFLIIVGISWNLTEELLPEVLFKVFSFSEENWFGWMIFHTFGIPEEENNNGDLQLR